MTLSLNLPKNSLTTFFGLLAGFPLLATQVHLQINPNVSAWITLVGIIGLGLTAKDVTSHSTQDEVSKATTEEAQTKK